jgi:hypothetical protein
MVVEWDMSELRDLVIEAHGGLAHWERLKTITADMSITGSLWARKGWPDVLRDVRVTAEIDNQLLSYRPFTAEGLRSVYRPEEVAIEGPDGKPIKTRRAPRAAFDGHSVETTWDDLHLAYFSGYAMWNYLNAPFLFRWPGFATEEIEPVVEDGSRRRRLRVTFPEHVATHCAEQVFYIDDEGLIARLDYFAGVTGGIPTAHYVGNYRDVDGLKLWTRRRAYRRNPDGSANTSMIAVAIDLADIRLS